MVGAAKRIDALEARVAALEASKKAPAAEPCPFCAAPMKLIDEAPHPEFGFGGRKVRTYRCESFRKTVNRDWQPPE